MMAKRIALLAGVYAVLGWLGVQLAIPPGYATVLFPAAGIGLAALLVHGRGLWPGVWLGSFLLNMGITVQTGAVSPGSLVPASAIATCAAAQAVLGSWLVERFVPRFVWLDRLTDIVRFLLLAGPLSCLAGGILSPSILALAGVVPFAQLPWTMLVWWVGDGLGVVLAAPLALLVLLRDEPIWGRRIRVVALPTVVGALVVLLLFWLVHGWERDRQRQHFERQAGDLTQPLLDHVQFSTFALEEAQIIAQTNPALDQAILSMLMQRLRQKVNGLYALSWAPRVTADNRAKFEKTMRTKDRSDFALYQKSPQNERQPVGARESYFPIQYIEPVDLRASAQGFDIASHPVRLEAMIRAAGQNSLQASGVIDLVTTRTPEKGIVIYAPVWNTPPQRGTGSLDDLKGVVLGAFHLQDLVEGVLSATTRSQLALVLTDITQPGQPQILYSNGLTASRHGHSWQTHIPVAGRLWEFRIAEGNVPGYFALQSWGVLVGGLLLTALLQIYLLEASAQTTRIRNTILERTRQLELENRNRLRAETQLQDSRATLQAVIDTVMDGIITIDENGLVIHANPAAEIIFGYDLSQMVGQNVSMLMPEPYRSAHDGYLARYRETGKTRTIGMVREVQGLRRDGSIFPMELSVAPATLKDRRLFTGVVRDISRRKQLETDLQLAASVFHETMEGVLIADGQGTILSVNPAFTTITGYEAAEVLGQNPRVLKSDRHDTVFYVKLWQTLQETGHYQGEIWNRRKNGEAFLVWQSITLIRGDDGRPARFVAVFKDVTEIRQEDQRIRHVAFHDALTGLPNRLLLADRLDHALENARRSHTMVAALFLDLDGFKAVNDTLGHDVGDDLLREVARRLTDTVRGSDTVARLGGDEFVVVLEQPANADEVLAIANRIIAEINVPMEFSGRPARVGTSVGIAIAPDHGSTREELMRRADAAMYVAKRSGKNGWALPPAETGATV